MRGLELSRRYWDAHGASLFDGLPDDACAAAAVGLVGMGSECLGFDDDASQDHDFGPGFCVWLPSGAFAHWGEELRRRYEALPREFLGYRRRETALAGQRVGVFETGAFYRGLTGLDRAPASSAEWLAIPEQLLACATNGEVFSDPSGQFSELRRVYQGFYPTEVLKKKLSADCASMAQAGQYNLPRSLGRGDLVAANAARSEFVMSLMAALHLLSRTYMPFYKWSFRSLVERAAVPARLSSLVERIAAAPAAELCPYDVEAAAGVVSGMLARLGWVVSRDGFLLDAAEELCRGLEDPYLRGLPIGAGQFRS